MCVKRNPTTIKYNRKQYFVCIELYISIERIWIEKWEIIINNKS